MRDIASYSPEDGALLYHYCSGATLLAVLQNKTLRLADVSEMNDSLEREWGLDLLAEALAARGDQLPPEFLQVMDAAIVSAKVGSMCLASCFSTKGDVLSQWRAYAENGSGFAIGLDPSALEGLPVTLLQVCYDRQAQVERIEDGLDHVLDLYRQIGSADERALSIKVWTDGLTGLDAELTPLEKLQVEHFVRAAQYLVYDLVAFKSHAFAEESEVRVVHFAHVDSEHGHRVELVSNDPPEAWPSGREPQLQFVMRNSVPICHADIPIPLDAIKEVVIGPRAAVSELAIRRLLSSTGFSHTEVSKSAASYR